MLIKSLNNLKRCDFFFNLRPATLPVKGWGLSVGEKVECLKNILFAALVVRWSGVLL